MCVVWHASPYSCRYYCALIATQRYVHETVCVGGGGEGEWVNGVVGKGREVDIRTYVRTNVQFRVTRGRVDK